METFESIVTSLQFSYKMYRPSDFKPSNPGNMLEFVMLVIKLLENKVGDRKPDISAHAYNSPAPGLNCVTKLQLHAFVLILVTILRACVFV
jgi:hypothetical protein